MGTNVGEFFVEANRILKFDGILIIAEVKSRIVKQCDFIRKLKQFGFLPRKKNHSNTIFVIFEFRKVKDISNASKSIVFHLDPCLYKKR